MKKKILATVAVLAVIAGVITVAVVSSDKKTDTESESSANIAIESDVSDITDENYEKENAESAYFTCTGYSDMDLKDGAAVYLKNDAENEQFGIYVKYDIYDDQGVQIFSSDLIEPGKQIDFIPSDYLSSGSYVISIVQTPYIYNEETDTYDSKFPGVQEINLTIR